MDIAVLSVKFTGDVSGLDRAFSQAQRKVTSFRRSVDPLTNIQVTADVSQFNKSLDSASAKANEVRANVIEQFRRMRISASSGVDLAVNVNTSSLDSATGTIERFKSTNSGDVLLTVKANLDDLTSASARVGEFRRQVAGASATIPLGVDYSALNTAISAVGTFKRTVEAKDPRIGIDVDTSGVASGMLVLDRLDAKASEINRRWGHSIDLHANPDFVAAMAQLAILEQRLDALDGRTINIDTSSASNAISGLDSKLRNLGAAVTVASIPVLISAIGAIPAVALTATTYIAGLAGAIGTGLVGAAGPAAAALGLMAAGVKASIGLTAQAAANALLLGDSFGTVAGEVKAAGDQVKAANELVSAMPAGTDAAAAAQERLRIAQEYEAAATQNQIDWWGQFGASANSLQSSVNELRLGFVDMTSDMSGQLIPTMQRFVDIGITMLPMLAGPLDEITQGIIEVGNEFANTLEKAETLAVIQVYLDAIGGAAAPALNILTNGFTAALYAMVPVVAQGEAIIRVLSTMSERMDQWVQSAEGQAYIYATWQTLFDYGTRLYEVLTDLASGFYDIGAAIAASGMADFAMTSLEVMAQGFREVTSDVGAMSVKMEAMKPILSAIGLLVTDVTNQFLIMADTVLTAINPDTGNSTLVDLVTSLRDAVAIIGPWLTDTFIALGPAVAEVIPPLTEFVTTFVGSSDFLVSFVENLGWMAETFNSLPEPVKSVASEVAAFSVALNLMTGTDMGGIVSGFSDLMISVAGLRALGLGGMFASLAGYIASAATATWGFVGALWAGEAAAWAAFAGVAAIVGLGVIAIDFIVNAPDIAAEFSSTYEESRAAGHTTGAAFTDGLAEGIKETTVGDLISTYVVDPLVNAIDSIPEGFLREKIEAWFVIDLPDLDISGWLAEVADPSTWQILDTSAWTDGLIADIKEGWNSFDWGQLGLDVINGIGEGIMGTDLWALAKTGFDAFVAGVKSYFGIGSPSTLAATWGTDIVLGLVGSFASLPGLMTTQITTWATALATTLSTWGVTIIAAVQAWWDGIILGVTTAWTMIVATVTTWVTTLMTTLTTWGVTIIATVQAWWDGMVLGVTTAWTMIVTTVTTWITTLIETLTTWGVTIIATVQAWWDGIVLGVTTAWTTVTSTVSTAVTYLIETLAGWGESIVSTVQGWWDSITAATATAWQGIYDTISGWVTSIYDWLVTQWDALSSYTTSTFDAIWTYLSSTWNSIYTEVSALVTQIYDWVIAQWDAISAYTTTTFDAVWSYLSATWTSIYDEVSALLTSIYDWVVTQWDAISAYTTTTFDAVWTYLSDTWNSIYTEVTTILSDLWTAIEDTWTGITDGVSAFGANFLEAVTTAFWDAVAVGGDAIATLLEAIGGAAIATTIDSVVTIGETLQSAGGEVRTLTGAAEGGVATSAGIVGFAGGGCACDEVETNFARGGMGTTMNRPRLHLWNEQQGNEAYIAQRGPRNKQVSYLDTAASWFGLSVVPGPLDDPAGSQHAALRRKSPSGRRSRSHANGGLAIPVVPHQLGGAHWGYSEDTQAIVNKIAAQSGGCATNNTYYGHSYRAGCPEENNVDWWGLGGRGDPVDFGCGEMINSLALAEPSITYTIWQGVLSDVGAWPDDPHYDHVHTAFCGGGGGGGSGLGCIVANTAKAVFQAAATPFVDTAKGAMDGVGMPLVAETGKGYIDQAVSAIIKYIVDLLPGCGPSGKGGAGPSGGDCMSALPGALKAMGLEGTSYESMMPGLIACESGGDSQAQNPSGASGCAQMMPSTFDAYQLPGCGDIWDPMCNLQASMNYQNQVYGGAVAGCPYLKGGLASYCDGGEVPGSGPQLAMVHGGERVLTQSENRAFQQGGVTTTSKQSPAPTPTVHYGLITSGEGTFSQTVSGMPAGAENISKTVATAVAVGAATGAQAAVNPAVDAANMAASDAAAPAAGQAAFDAANAVATPAANAAAVPAAESAAQAGAMAGAQAAAGAFNIDLSGVSGTTSQTIQDTGTIQNENAGTGSIHQSTGRSANVNISESFTAETLPSMATGGIVPGTGPRLALLHGGERVLSAEENQALMNNPAISGGSGIASHSRGAMSRIGDGAGGGGSVRIDRPQVTFNVSGDTHGSRESLLEEMREMQEDFFEELLGDSDQLRGPVSRGMG